MRTVLRLGWLISPAIAVGAFILGGYYSWAAIIIWGAAVSPLVLLTARHLRERGTPISMDCVKTALAIGIGLTAFSAIIGAAPAALPSLGPPAVVYIVVGATWLAMLGQAAYVFTTTRWMLLRV